MNEHRAHVWLAAGALLLFLATGCGSDRSRPDSELPARGPEVAASEGLGDLMTRLEEHRQAGRHQEGLVSVRQALELSPNEAPLHFHHGLFLRATGDAVAAEVALAKALELQPAHYPSHRALGDLARDRGAPTEAVEHFSRCIAGLPDHAGCRYGLALAQVDLGELDAAAEQLSAAAEQLDRADVWSELGRLERRRRRVEASITTFARALALDRTHLPTLLGLGQALVAAGRKEEGEALLEKHRQEAATQDQLDALRRAASQPGAEADIQLQMARLHGSRDAFQEAEAAYREALARARAGGDPSWPPAVLALANHLLHYGDAEEADELVAELPAELVGDPAVLFLQGTIDLARGDAAAATAHFDASLANGPWPPPVYLDAGKAWSKAGLPKQAAAAFGQAITGMPDLVEAHLGLARSQRALGDQKQAFAVLRRALEADPKEGRGWLLLGVLEAENGDRPDAVQAFRRGLEVRKLDLLPANGAAEIRREIEALSPPEIALEIFDQAFAELEVPRAQSVKGDR